MSRLTVSIRVIGGAFWAHELTGYSEEKWRLRAKFFQIDATGGVVQPIAK